MLFDRILTYVHLLVWTVWYSITPSFVPSLYLHVFHLLVFVYLPFSYYYLVDWTNWQVTRWTGHWTANWYVRMDNLAALLDIRQRRKKTGAMVILSIDPAKFRAFFLWLFLYDLWQMHFFFKFVARDIILFIFQSLAIRILCGKQKIL